MSMTISIMILYPNFRYSFTSRNAGVGVANKTEAFSYSHVQLDGKKCVVGGRENNFLAEAIGLTRKVENNLTRGVDF